MIATIDEKDPNCVLLYLEDIGSYFTVSAFTIGVAPVAHLFRITKISFNNVILFDFLSE